MATIGRIKINARGRPLGSSIHQNTATWTAIIGMGLALAGVIFTAGDAKQMLVNDHGRLDSLETQQRVVLMEMATLSAQMEDVRGTVHHVDGTPVPRLPTRR